MSATLTESTFEASGYKWCVHSLTDNCHHAPCNIAQGVECCGECRYVRACTSPCWAFRNHLEPSGT